MLTLTVAAVVVYYSNAFRVTVGSHVNVNRSHFLKSASSLNMSSLDSLLLSCRYSAEKRALLSSVPEASLNRGLEDRGQRSEGVGHDQPARDCCCHAQAACWSSLDYYH